MEQEFKVVAVDEVQIITPVPETIIPATQTVEVVNSTVINGQIDAIQSDTDGQIASIQSDINVLNGQIASYSQEVADKTQEIADLHAKMDKDVAELKAKLTVFDKVEVKTQIEAMTVAPVEEEKAVTDTLEANVEPAP